MSEGPLKSCIDGAWALPTTSAMMVNAINPTTLEIKVINGFAA